MGKLSGKLIAVDFDGTIAHHCYPRIGEPIEGAFEVMRELQVEGARLILHTCREDKNNYWHGVSPVHPQRYDQPLTEAVEFCRANGIEFVGVNETPRDADFRENGGRKVYAHYYIDDRLVGG